MTNKDPEEVRMPQRSPKKVRKGSTEEYAITGISMVIMADAAHVRQRMESKNQTIITEFILLGFTTNPKINIVLFVLFLAIYVVTTVGNSLIILMVITNPKLHKPMYFFLYLFSTERTISRMACAFQIYIILLVEGSECQLLAVMAYDRLCYNRINHFMCEMLAIIKLACEDISSNELTVFSISFLTLLLPLLLILLSYAAIISSVLKIRSAGRSKAFSTCTSHLGVVALYFGTVMLMYFGPSSMYSTDQEKYSSIFYVIVSPMLNPLIYSLNNREVKESFKKFLMQFTQRISV
ncbi:olfactory receptor 2F1-like [Leptodactylus fuscus]|uniref:olfactory receptor 2F1-like n=1 Tax=Leptodactylus fuscus TaxID=238119 RepID=UPI003F4E92B5